MTDTKRPGSFSDKQVCAVESKSGRLARVVKSQIALAIDLLLLLDLSAIAVIALTGGARWDLGWTAVRATSVANPVLAAVLLVAIRYTIRFWRPHLAWAESLQIDATLSWLAAAMSRIRTRLDAATTRELIRLFLAVAAASLALRILNVFMHPGFLTGDDVELHEMTLRSIFGTDWPVWNLRSPLYPMAFLYPAQYAAVALLQLTDVSALVATGRFVVVVIATAALWLGFRIGRELAGPAAGVLAFILIASSRLHLWYGSSELPRPVATVFILGAFLLLLRPSHLRSAAAGAALGLGGSLRFGEFVFLLPAAIHLSRERRWLDVVIVGAVGIVTALALLGAADAWYWGRPFYSLRNAYEYTIVERQSSRGFQPAWFYLTSATSWSNYIVIVLSLYSFRVADRRAAIWGWVPVLVLSLLPHKEARYLVAAQPFVCLSAALGAERLLHRCGTATNRARATAALAVALAAAVAVELGDWRVRRSDEAVRFARALAGGRPRSIAAQQLWRLGGRLYFRLVPSVSELSDNMAAALESIKQERFEWVLLRRDWAGAEAVEELQQQRYTHVPTANLEYVVFTRKDR